MIRTNLRNRLVILLLAISVLPFASSVLFTYFYTRDSLKDQFVQENVNLLSLGKVHLESYMDELMDITLTFYSDPNFIAFLRTADQADDYETFWTVRSRLTQVLYANEGIRRVSIALIKDNRTILVSKSQVTFTGITEKQRVDFAKVARSPNRIYIETIQDGAAGSRAFTIMRSLTDAPKSDLLAYFTIEVATDQVAEIGRKLYTDGQEHFSILTSEGEPVFVSDAAGSDPELVERVISSRERSGTLVWGRGDRRGIVIYERIERSGGGWILLKSIPYENLFRQGNRITQINIAFGVVGISLAVLAAVLFSFRITSPLRILVENIRRIEKGKMEVGFKSLGHDEIGVLGESFRQMIGRINHLIDREYKLEIENKTNQLKVLQSQINPHFLHNALQSIGSLALKNRGAEVYTLVTNLSKIMRYSMNTDEDKVTLKREAANAEAFLLLHKERYCDEFEYAIDFEQEALRALLPKMLLQPVIENYFKHGIGTETGKKGRLRVEGRKEGDSLVIRIADNGPGIDPGRMQELDRRLREEKRSEPGEEANIGLRSVYLRLKLYYGARGSLQLENRREGGLLVTIRLPIEFEGGDGAE
ncbi:sensor histidine kinase [Paenibacillus sp.]|uniref:sensor histidine kinase n=1 Tax=Paenibacillus sp. TaxID=58172 RepID=UPI002D6D11FB|nr:sensor histidine kinase [Paenibacillus sp.]HZG85583.1 sensor histidine kinase [Paenibacillus sp.]